ncbi:hypothetical protein Gyru_ORF118 [Gynaephora ruoergensis nucleopolyhedrovirus]|nr:hypothetical protein Gyru_ORF118 [Gynaephora ruoergensis nucleopolyhedrovirus]
MIFYKKLNSLQLSKLNKLFGCNVARILQAPSTGLDDFVKLVVLLRRFSDAYVVYANQLLPSCLTFDKTKIIVYCEKTDVFDYINIQKIIKKNYNKIIRCNKTINVAQIKLMITLVESSLFFN